jgi:hypothetical protein
MKKLLLIKKSLNEDLNNTYVAYLDARIFHESLAATTDMAVLPGVLGCRPLQRTVQVRLGFDFGFWISDLGFLSTINDI